MNDLVKRLRSLSIHEAESSGFSPDEGIMWQAADKIDFLEAALKAAIEDIDFYKAEIDRANLAGHESDHDRQKAWDYAEELKQEIERLQGDIKVLSESL